MVGVVAAASVESMMKAKNHLEVRCHFLLYITYILHTRTMPSMVGPQQKLVAFFLNTESGQEWECSNYSIPTTGNLKAFRTNPEP